MKKTKIVAATMCVALCSTFLFGCSGATYKLNKDSIQEQFTQVKQVDLKGGTYETTKSTDTDDYIIATKLENEVTTYGIYSVKQDKLVVDYGKYLSVDLDGSRADMNAASYRMIVSKKVGEEVKYGVINLATGEECIDFNYTTESIYDWELFSVGECAYEFYGKYNDKKPAGQVYNKIKLETGVTEQISYLAIEEGKTNLIDMRYPAQLYSSTNLEGSLAQCTFIFNMTSFEFYNEKGKKVGTYENDITPYTGTFEDCFDGKIFRQKTLQLDEYATDYDFFDGTNKYKLVSEFFDIKTGKTSSIKLNYLIDEGGVVCGGEEDFLSFTAQEIVDKHLKNDAYYVSSLDFKNISKTFNEISPSTKLISMEKGNILDATNRRLYNGKFEYIGRISGTVVDANSKNILINKDDDAYVLNEEGIAMKKFTNVQFECFSGDFILATKTIKNADETTTTKMVKYDKSYVETEICTLGGDNNVQLKGSSSGVIEYQSTADTNISYKVVTGNSQIFEKTVPAETAVNRRILTNCVLYTIGTEFYVIK